MPCCCRAFPTPTPTPQGCLLQTGNSFSAPPSKACSNLGSPLHSHNAAAGSRELYYSVSIPRLTVGSRKGRNFDVSCSVSAVRVRSLLSTSPGTAGWLAWARKGPAWLRCSGTPSVRQTPYHPSTCYSGTASSVLHPFKEKCKFRNRGEGGLAGWHPAPPVCPSHSLGSKAQTHSSPPPPCRVIFQSSTLRL